MVSEKLDENSCPLYIDKTTFHQFACIFVMRRGHEVWMHSTFYCEKISSVLIHMYCTANVDIPEDFIVELS